MKKTAMTTNHSTEQSAVDQGKIQLFLQMKEREFNDLQYECIRLGLPHDGTKEDLIRRLVNTVGVQQNVEAPQAFAIRSQGDQEAQEFVRAANARILPQDPQTGKVLRDKMLVRTFQFLDRDGNNYEMDCPCVQLRDETTAKMVEKNWLFALDSQRNLIAALREKPADFICHLIRKKTTDDGRFYLMVHVVKRPTQNKEQGAA